MSDQINVNALADTLNQKVDIPDGVNQSDVDYVVESKFPTDSDPTWYRVYKSGWVEQGGLYNAQQITLLKPMIDTNYYASAISAVTTSYTMRVQAKATITIDFQTSASAWHNYLWEVKGMGA